MRSGKLVIQPLQQTVEDLIEIRAMITVNIEIICLGTAAYALNL